MKDNKHYTSVEKAEMLLFLGILLSTFIVFLILGVLTDSGLFFDSIFYVVFAILISGALISLPFYFYNLYKKRSKNE